MPDALLLDAQTYHTLFPRLIPQLKAIFLRCDAHWCPGQRIWDSFLLQPVVTFLEEMPSSARLYNALMAHIHWQSYAGFLTTFRTTTLVDIWQYQRHQGHSTRVVCRQRGPLQIKNMGWNTSGELAWLVEQWAALRYQLSPSWTVPPVSTYAYLWTDARPS
jgi:hypothetical protein